VRGVTPLDTRMFDGAACRWTDLGLQKCRFVGPQPLVLNPVFLLIVVLVLTLTTSRGRSRGLRMRQTGWLSPNRKLDEEARWRLTVLLRYS